MTTPDRALSYLKRVLQRELHDSRVGRIGDLAKGVAIQGSAWIYLSKAVRHIECLGSKLQFLTFPELEISR